MKKQDDFWKNTFQEINNRNNVFVVLLSKHHILQFSHQMFNVSA